MNARISTSAVVAAAAIALSGCSSLVLENLPAPDALGGAGRYTITAQFRDVENLALGAKVKLEGVVVGDVLSIATKNYVANVKMEIEKRFPLSKDAKFQIRFTTPLGEDFVSVRSIRKPGVGDLKNGAMVRLDNTSDAPTIEDTFAAVSTLLNGGGLSQIHIIATELQTMLRGRTGQVRDLTNQLQTVVANFDAHKGDLDNALTALASLTKQLNDGNSLINQALEQFPSTIQLLATDTGKLSHLLTRVSKLGDTVRGLVNNTSDNLATMLDNLRPTLDALKSADGDLIPTFKSLINFGTLFDRAAPGDYVNLYLNIYGLFESPGYKPQKGGYPNSDGAVRITGATTSGTATLTTLLTGGGR